MLSCTKGSLNHLFSLDSLKEKRGKVAVINVRSSACSVELVLMAANAMPFQPPPPYSINILFHGCLRLQKNTVQRKGGQMLHPPRTAPRSLAQKTVYHGQLSFACL